MGWLPNWGRNLPIWILAAGIFAIIALPCLLFPDAIERILPSTGKAIRELPSQTLLLAIAICVLALCIAGAYRYIHSRSRVERFGKILIKAREAIREDLSPEDRDSSLTAENTDKLLERMMKTWVDGHYPSTGSDKGPQNEKPDDSSEE